MLFSNFLFGYELFSPRKIANLKRLQRDFDSRNPKFVFRDRTFVYAEETLGNSENFRIFNKGGSLLSQPAR